MKIVSCPEKEYFEKNYCDRIFTCRNCKTQFELEVSDNKNLITLSDNIHSNTPNIPKEVASLYPEIHNADEVKIIRCPYCSHLTPVSYTKRYCGLFSGPCMDTYILGEKK